ncbi:MAG: hypothetical protein JOZ62_05660, partial [Acidobacteriaceae bacterium]|nr:hypothetical protein [Acidobacteriaceae bacterium]
SGASRFSGLSKAASTASAPAPVGERPRPQFSHESLGTQVIEGLTVEGTRTTVTYPEGFFGNDRPITSTSDTWYSRDLNLTVLSETDDPRQGKSVTKLTNISRDEPDPALFQIPSDYTVEDQPEPNLVTAPANR